MTSDTIDNGVTMSGASGTLLAGRYRIVKQLGQGGMGSVWLAEDTQLDNKPFAIKMLPSILVSNKRAYRQLKDEALVAMKLTHPNIVTLRAFEENNGNPFLVMDYVDGETLDDYIAECGDGFSTQRRRDAECAEVGDGRARSPSGPQSTCLPESEVVRILKPIAAALDYAHSQGVVHRDVKPANIMIRKDGHPYILDFGIAREIQETMTRVTGKLSSGTLLYMSPEQLNGDAPKPAQDVYSFAAMAYECLKGEPPFVRGAIEDQIKNKIPEPLTGKAAILAAGVMSGLAKKPEDRPPTCSAVIGGGCSGGVPPSHSDDGIGGGPKQEAIKARVEAKIREKHFVELPDEHGFAERKRALADDMFRAEMLFESGVWADAAAMFSAYAKSCDALAKLAIDMRNAISKQENAAQAKRNVNYIAECDFPTLRSANQTFAEAERHFGDMQFAAAASLYERAQSSFELIKREVDRKAREAREEAERKAREDAECKAREYAERKAREEAERKARENAEREAREEALRKGTCLETGICRTITLPDGAKIEMIYCPPGEFMMGSPETEKGRQDDETQHHVILTKGFWIGKYPVTEAQWRSVMGNIRSKVKGDDFPVENVSWDDSQKFIKKVNSLLAWGVRLPTEAEWEYACRAGTTTAYFWGNALKGDKANCDGGRPCGTKAKGPWLRNGSPVGRYSPNPWGLYDMHGNVMEWCADWYGGYPLWSVVDPAGPASGDSRVARGGCWLYPAEDCRSAFRSWFEPDGRGIGLGFRLCCSAGSLEEAERKSREEAEREVPKEAEWRAYQREELRKTGITDTITLPGGVEMEMVYCPPGEFMMGSPETEEGRYKDETQHRVRLTKGFWLGKYPVTQRQWKSVMGNNPSRFKSLGVIPWFKSDDRPVESVSWDDCQEFIDKVNEALGCEARLPTEAEWEYACRAWMKTAYCWGNALNGDKANCNGELPCGTKAKGPSLERPSPVGRYSPNPWGLFDMHGNVWEWCADLYGDYPSCRVVDPTGPALGDGRVQRGGSWFVGACFCRSASRFMCDPDLRSWDCGFRLCCSAGPRE